MPNPSINQLFIQFYCFLHGFVSCLVIGICIKLLSSICSSNKMNHSFVSSISQMNCTPASFIENSLPHILISISRTIHYTSITKNDCGGVTRLSNFNKDIFQIHLKFHQTCLKLNSTWESHFGCLNERSTFH